MQDWSLFKNNMHGKSIFEKIIIKLINICPENILSYIDILEYYYSFSLKKTKEYIRLQMKWCDNEASKVNWKRADRLLFIGAGSIPYTAIYFSRRLDNPICVLEKNWLACFLGRNVLRKLKMDNKIIYINQSSMEYKDYHKYDIVYIASYTINKFSTVKRVLRMAKKVAIIIRGEDFRLIKNSKKIKDSSVFGEAEIASFKNKYKLSIKKYAGINSFFYIFNKRQ